jgi:hypothetical protein
VWIIATCPNFLDKKDSRFKPLLGAHFHKLHSSGVGTDIKHARVLTKDDEKLWRSGVMAVASSRGCRRVQLHPIISNCTHGINERAGSCRGLSCSHDRHGRVQSSLSNSRDMKRARSSKQIQGQGKLSGFCTKR